MRKALILVFTFIFISGCNAVQYGWDSPDFENQLVKTSTPRGSARIAQIVDYDASVKNLLSNGFQPEYLYEIDSDNFYLISLTNNTFYHMLRPGLDTDSKVRKIESLPRKISDLLPQHSHKTTQVVQAQEATNQSTSVATIEPKEVPKSVATIESKEAPKEDIYTMKKGKFNVRLVGYRYKEKVPKQQLAQYGSTIYGEILSDETTRLADSYSTNREKYQVGSRREVNQRHIRAQIDLETAQRRYHEVHSQDAVKGYNATTSFFAGMLSEKMRHDAEEQLYNAKMRLMNEPPYNEVPEYSYRTVQVPVLNLERVVKLRFYKFEGSKPVGTALLTKILTSSEEYSSQRTVSYEIDSINGQRITVYDSELNFK